MRRSVQKFETDILSPVGSKRNLLLDTLGQHVFNDLPAHLIRIDDMKLLSRTDLWEDLCASIYALSNYEVLALSSPTNAMYMKPHALMRVSCIYTIHTRSSQEDARTRIKYAIFSHRWGAREPSYQQLTQNERWMEEHSPTNSPGIVKLLRFCDKARAHGCAYAWSDTCCIDKLSSAELEEAIRSMYRWYRDAEVCIVHLAATETLADFEHEPWFRRGWTLQELLAPKQITFYTKYWVPVSVCNDRLAETMNHKEDWRVLGAVTRVTGIPAGDLRHFRPGCERISEKMRWASRRQTTRMEDIAYSLIGIFDITMPISYGEGRWAFHRLMECIIQHCSEPGFFAWGGDSSPYSLAFPSSPESYGTSALDPQTATSLRLTGSVFEQVGDRSYCMTKLGLQVRLLLLPVHWIPQEQSLENYTLSFTQGRFLESHPKPTLSQAYYEIFKPEQCVLGVINYARVGSDRGSIRAGERYLCFLLKQSARCYIKARTDKVLAWQCVEGVTRDLEDVCLLNYLTPYDRDITA